MAQKQQSNALGFEVIKQYPGPQQVQRAVKVNVPGKHFPQLQPAEQKVDYEGTAEAAAAAAASTDAAAAAAAGTAAAAAADASGSADPA